MSIIAIDPGCTESAWAIIDADGTPTAFGKQPNRDVLWLVRDFPSGHTLVIEWLASYGMPAGFEVFETAMWVGRFVEAWEGVSAMRPASNRLYRQDVKLHLCGTPRAKDGNVRRALLDRFGGDKAAKGTKKHPGPCYGMSKDVWAALAVACAWHDGVRSKIKGAT